MTVATLSNYVRCFLAPSFFGSALVMPAAGGTPQKIPVCISIRRHVTSYQITLRVKSIALAGSCAWDIDGDELSITLNEAVLVSILAVIEARDISLGVYAGDPREGRAGKVDGGEVSCLAQKAMEYTITAEVGANNSCRVDDYRWKRSHRARDIDQSELTSAEKVAVPVKKISADIFHAYDVASVADPETNCIYRSGARKVDCRKCAPAHQVAVHRSAGTGVIVSYNVATGVDPANEGGSGAWNINGSENAVA